MIYLFRREMKKWQSVLWVVLASLAISTVSMVFFRQRNLSEIKVATVNGSPIYFDQFRKTLATVQERVNGLRPLARAYGMSEEMFLQSFLGVSSAEEMALNNCVRDKLFDDVKNSFSLQLDHEWFRNELLKIVPSFVDQNGAINMIAYQNHLMQRGMTPASFEKTVSEELKRDSVQRFIQNSAYVPQFVMKELLAREHTAKRFEIATFSLDHFLAIAKKEVVSDKDLHAFYLTKKEEFRVSEKRKVSYWVIDTESYARSIDIDQAAVRNFYEKNKSANYRIAPKIKVRHILIKNTTKNAADTAQKLYKEVIAAPDSFAALARQNSNDDKTASNGGLVDFFAKGTYSHEFELAAFRLQNAGDIAPIVKTTEGFEIVQLVERKAASEKPFEVVKEEIERTLRTKRAHGILRSEIEATIRNAKDSKDIFFKFVQKLQLKEESLGLVSADIKQEGPAGAIIRSIFAGNKQDKVFGYLPYENKYLIYHQSAIEKSYIPALENIKVPLHHAYVSERAETLIKEKLHDTRAALLSKKLTMNQLKETPGVSLMATDFAIKPSELKQAGDDRMLKEKLFTLSDLHHVLQYEQNGHFCLARVVEMKPKTVNLLQTEELKIIKQEKYKSASQQVGAFIASLNKNAKIEVDKKMLSSQRTDVKD
jgi:parvulin-like peptidyl-prolyl isomerase